MHRSYQNYQKVQKEIELIKKIEHYEGRLEIWDEGAIERFRELGGIVEYLEYDLGEYWENICTYRAQLKKLREQL